MDIARLRSTPGCFQHRTPARRGLRGAWLGIVASASMAAFLWSASVHAEPDVSGSSGVEVPPMPHDPNANAPVAPTEAAKQAAYSRQLVCKEEATLGTRVTKKVCRTRKQTEQERIASQQFLDKIQTNSKIQPNGGQ